MKVQHLTGFFDGKPSGVRYLVWWFQGPMFAASGWKITRDRGFLGLKVWVYKPVTSFNDYPPQNA